MESVLSGESEILVVVGHFVLRLTAERKTRSIYLSSSLLPLLDLRFLRCLSLSLLSYQAKPGQRLFISSCPPLFNWTTKLSSDYSPFASDQCFIVTSAHTKVILDTYKNTHKKPHKNKSSTLTHSSSSQYF